MKNVQLSIKFSNTSKSSASQVSWINAKISKPPAKEFNEFILSPMFRAKTYSIFNPETPKKVKLILWSLRNNLTTLANFTRMLLCTPWKCSIVTCWWMITVGVDLVSHKYFPWNLQSYFCSFLWARTRIFSTNRVGTKWQNICLRYINSIKLTFDGRLYQ